MKEVNNTHYEIAKMTKEEEEKLAQLEQKLCSEVRKEFVLIAYEKKGDIQV